MDPGVARRFVWQIGGSSYVLVAPATGTDGWSTLETGPRYQQNCTECHKEKARPIRSEPQESQAAPWRLQSISSGPGGIPATERSPPNSGACHVQDSNDNEERAKYHQEHSRLSICRCPAQYNRTQASSLETVQAKHCNL